MLLDFTQWLMLGLSVFSQFFVWVLLHQPDPAYDWQTDIGYRDDVSRLEDDELYTISPTHNWRGLV